MKLLAPRDRPHLAAFGVALALILVTATSSPNAGTRPAENVKRVLALYWYDQDYPANVAFDRSFRAALNADSSIDVEYYAEYFDAGRFPGETQSDALSHYLRKKYADRVIDVVVAVSPVPLQFLLEHRDDLFASSPIVFYTGAGLAPIHRAAGRQITGVASPDGYRRTIEVALRLHPDTKRVFVISGTPDADKLIESQVYEQLTDFEFTLDVSYLTDLELDRLVATVKTLPQGSIILYARQSQIEPGRALSPVDFLVAISQAASVPVYSPGGVYVGHGSVGGHTVDIETGAIRSAEIALRVAHGTPTGQIPVVHVPTIPTFDGRQLARWRIKPAALPGGSVILFRPPSLWSRYWEYVALAALLGALAVAAIAVLLVQRARLLRAEAAWKNVEQRYAMATASGRVSVWDWTLDTGKTQIEPDISAKLGYTNPEEVTHTAPWWTDRIHPDDRGRLQAAVQSAIRGSTSSYEEDVRILHKDGSPRWFMVRGTVVRDQEGRAHSVVGTLIDISDSKERDAQLEEARQELTRVSGLAALGEVAASIAHEVSQPLAAVIMNARACLRWLDSADRPLDEIRSALNDIAAAGGLAKEVVRRNQELFQHHTVERHLLDVNSVVRDVAALARLRLQRSGVTLVTRLEDKLPSVLGDRVQLQQVLLNLILNGIHAMEPVNTSRSLEVLTHRVNGLVHVAVKDVGVGLGDADTEQIFRPFYTTKPHGTGVGLSISRSIVEAHDGSLWAEPNAGPGTTFYFTVPVAGDVPPDAFLVDSPGTAAYPDDLTRTH